jgi:phage shock protein C
MIVRVIMVVLAMINGIGFAVYLLMWVLVPAAQVEYTNQEEMVRRNVEEIRNRARELGDGARDALGDRWYAEDRGGSRMLIGGVVLVGVGLLVLLRNFGLLWWFGKLWPLVLIAVGVAVLLSNLKEKP